MWLVDRGERFHDQDLVTLARQGRGRALLHLGRAGEAFDRLDEAMLAVTHAGVSPLVVGIVFCSVLDAYRDVFARLGAAAALAEVAALERDRRASPHGLTERETEVLRAVDQGRRGA